MAMGGTGEDTARGKGGIKFEKISLRDPKRSKMKRGAGSKPYPTIIKASPPLTHCDHNGDFMILLTLSNTDTRFLFVVQA